MSWLKPCCVAAWAFGSSGSSRWDKGEDVSTNTAFKIDQCVNDRAIYRLQAMQDSECPSKYGICPHTNYNRWQFTKYICNAKTNSTACQSKRSLQSVSTRHFSFWSAGGFDQEDWKMKQRGWMCVCEGLPGRWIPILANATSCAFKGWCSISLYSLPMPCDQNSHPQNLTQQQLDTDKDWMNETFQLEINWINVESNEKLIVSPAPKYILNIVCFSGLCINTHNSASFSEICIQLGCFSADSSMELLC